MAAIACGVAVEALQQEANAVGIATVDSAAADAVRAGAITAITASTGVVRTTP